MRGHQPLIAMRQRRVAPRLVRFETEPSGWNDWQTWPEWSSTPMIDIEPADKIGRLDLRFMVGLPAAVGGRDGARVDEMVRALLKAGATKVVAMRDDLNTVEVHGG